MNKLSVPISAFSLLILTSVSLPMSQAQALEKTATADKSASATLTRQYDQSVFKRQQDPEVSNNSSVGVMAVPVDPIDPGDGGGGGGGSGGGSGGSGSQWAYDNMDARMNIKTGVTEHTTDLLGDRIDTNTGGLTFSHTDISIPGNFSLPVTLQRSFKGIRYAHYNTLDVGDWMIDIPHIHTTLVRNRTRYSGEWGQGRECSGSLNPGEIAYYGDTYMNYDYWNGDTLNVPGRTNERLLENSGKYTSQAAYPKVTQSGWRISCASNPSTDGELFIAQAPNGDKYTFSQLRLIGTSYLDKGTKPIPRFHAFMLVTKIEDLHGNSVHYRYNAQGQLYEIDASDGRQIDLDYNSSGRLQSASYGQREWQYHYSGTSLSEVTRPDGKSWHFDLYEMGLKRASSTLYCNRNAGNETFTVSLTHPDGLVGEFTLGEQQFGRANVQSLYRNRAELNGICFISMVLKEKRLSGPRLAADLVWDYRYSGRDGYYTSSNPGESERLSGNVPSGISRYETRRTQIILPDDTVQYLFYNRDFSSVFENKLVGKQTFSNDEATLLEEVTFSYDVGAFIGRTMQMIDNIKDDEYQSLLVQKKIDRQLSSDDIYVTEYSNFTQLGSPTVEVQSGNAGTRRIERTYRQIPARWILDLPAHTAIENVSHTHRNYNQYGELINVTRNGVTEAYDYSNGLLTKHTSPRGFVTTYHNYYRGVPRRITTSEGSEYREVNSYGDILSYTNRIGAESTYRYDTLGRLIRETPALGSATTVSYGDNQYTVTRGQHRKTYQLDGLNRSVLLTDTDLSSGNKRYQRWRHHENGQLEFRSVVSSSSSTSFGVSFEYDGLQRLTGRSDPYGTTDWRYLSNNRVRKTDPRNYQTTTYLEGYASPAGAMRVRIDAPSSSGTITTSMNYDAAGRMLSVNQAGKNIHYRYDNDFGDYLASEQYPAFTINYARDAAGNATQRWINSGSRTHYLYDRNNQLTEINYPGATPDVEFNYRADGVMISATNGVGNWYYQYNAIGQLTQSRLHYNGSNLRFNYSYNSDQHLSALSYPNGYSVSYAPDSRGQATRAGSLVTYLQRHANGTIRRMDQGSGLKTYTLFDSAGLRPTQVQVKSGSTFKLRKEYDYDAAGNVIAIDDRQYASYDVRNFQYDGINRLLSVYSPSFGTIGYQYDKRGNITRLTQAGQTQSYHYNSNDLLSSVTGAVSREFSYDSAGRVTDNGRINMSYNAADQMVAAGTEQYQYDAHGHRLTKPSDGATRLTVYSREGQLLMARQSGRDTYKVLLDGAVVAQVGSGGTRYFHHDVLGSVVAESRSSGSFKRQHYRPFGLQVDAYSSPNQQGYTGHVHDDTGLVYMQARYYDPVIGRFYSNDPVDSVSHLSRTGGIHGFNRYAYANNNPYKYTDPDGRETRLMVEAKHLDMDVAKGNMTQQERLDISAAQAEGMVSAVGALKVGAVAIKQGLKQYAKSLVKRNDNKNSVTMKTKDGHVRVDLQGKSHFVKGKGEVPTPHVQAYRNNVIPKGPRAGEVGSVTKTGETTPATLKDLRKVAEHLKSNGQ